MSAAAERRYEERFRLVDAKAKETLVLGAKVWRAGYDKVEEGKVIRVFPCRLNGHGDPIEDPAGLHICYGAEFYDHQRYEQQTYPWKFFAKESVARWRLVRDLKSRAEEYRLKILGIEEQMKVLEAAGTEVSPEDTI